MMSSHYHFAIFLAIIAATATAADASCKKIGNLITCELDVDGLDKIKYQNFLKVVRETSKTRDIQGVPLLPPQNAAKPPQWLDLKLTAKERSVQKVTTVKIRGDNLYVVGYQTQETPPKWYELKDSNYIPGATHLKFKGDYPSLFKEAGLKSTQVALSKSELVTAVKALAGPKPSNEAAIAKAVIVVAQMVSEACRFAYVAEFFANNLVQGTKLQKWIYPYIEGGKWEAFSTILLCYDKYNNLKENFVGEATPAGDSITRLGIVLDTKIPTCNDELSNVIDLHAHLHDVVKSATNNTLLAPPSGDADGRAVI